MNKLPFEKYIHNKSVLAHSDKKMKASLEKSKVLKDEMNKRLHEQSDYFNTEEQGFLEVDSDNDLERTLKVKQDDLKQMLGVQNT